MLIEKYTVICLKIYRKQQSEDSILDPVRGSMSSTSSFTQVSAMNDDFLSPRSSSGSTITQTPTTPKMEPQSSAASKIEVTPSSVPLPPVTSSEEHDLATPTSTSRELDVREATTTPEETQEVNDFFQQKTSEKRELQVKKDFPLGYLAFSLLYELLI